MFLLDFGRTAPAQAPERARVLILGDSISIGYTPHVQEILRDEAVVIRPTTPEGEAENCQGTTYGVERIDRWIEIDGGPWDVIHFNFGLHDLKRVDPLNGNNSNDPSHPRQAGPDRYRRQLRQITQKLEQTGARLIFATTTPVPPGGVRPHRDTEDPTRYNRIAREIMDERSIAVDDLFEFVLPHLPEIQHPVNVHFTEEGSRLLANKVADAIREAFNSSR